MRWRSAERQPPFPEHWRDLLSARLRWWPLADPQLHAQLEELIPRFLASKRFEAARGFTLSEDIEVTIAAEACLLIAGLGLEAYRDVTTIIVYPSTAIRTGSLRIDGGFEREGPTALSGEAMLHGPVVIAWDAALGAARRPERGHNVVYHEFAHKLDMADGAVDGMPLLRDRAASRRWSDVMGQALADLRNETPRFIDDYGATSPAELFAVLTEAFFDRPQQLRSREPEIYELLSDFYRQDPAER